MASTHHVRGRSGESYACQECGTTSLRWVGRCPACGEWNTLAAEPAHGRVSRRAGVVGALRGDGAVSLAGVSATAARPMPTGVSELDRVMGGGVVGGSVTLLFGPPGIGKSTLLFQVLASVAARGLDVMLASAEESLAQVSGRAARLGPVPAHLLALEGPDVDAIEDAVGRARPALVVVDSLQSISDPELSQPAGGLAQVRACVERLTRLAKSSGIPILLVGHVTKDGDLAGPRAVEHLVDTVLSFDGDRHHALRVLNAVKHRFGPTGEVGIFEMRDDGLRGVADPGPLMLGDRMAGVPGSTVVPVLQGRRPLLVEVQALLGPGGAGTSRPHALGIDAARANLLVAVLACRSTVPVPATGEFFVAAAGGIAVSEPAADLAVALALASVVTGRPVPADLVAFGELGLAGEVRAVPGAARRLTEAHRVGFTRALVPASSVDGLGDDVPAGIAIVGVRTLADALGCASGEPVGPHGGPDTMPWCPSPAAASL
jgi:DNA repair protein RadA/Sms